MNHFRWLAFAAITTVAAACTHTEMVEDREPTTTEKEWSNFAKQHCENLFERAVFAKKVKQIKEATGACEKAIQEGCAHEEKRVGGGAEGLLEKANCYRRAAFGSNKVVHEGKPTPECGTATIRANKSRTSADYEDANLVCKTGVEETCESKDVKKSKDPLANSRCYLSAARFGSLEVNGGNCEAYKSCVQKCDPKDESRLDCMRDCESTYDPNATCTRLH